MVQNSCAKLLWRRRTIFHSNFHFLSERLIPEYTQPRLKQSQKLTDFFRQNIRCQILDIVRQTLTTYIFTKKMKVHYQKHIRYAKNDQCLQLFHYQYLHRKTEVHKS